MLTLLTFPASFGQPSHSPYCVKAMCLLEMSGSDWHPEYLDNPSKMPLGKLPVLCTGDQLIPDSANIQSYLESHGADFYPGMSAKSQAQAHGFMKMAEDSLYLHLVMARWLDDANWPTVRDTFFAAIPGLIRRPVTHTLRKSVRKGLASQGISHFSEADRLDRLRRDLAAISAQLGTQSFLFGDAPCAADASFAPGLGMLLSLPADTPTRRIVRNWEGLEAYTLRCRKAMYPGAGKARLSAAA